MSEARLAGRAVSALLVALAAAPLGLMPAGVTASTIQDIYEWGGLDWDPRDPNPKPPPTTTGDLGTDGKTKFTVDYVNETGAWLVMNASPTASDEKFEFQLLNNTRDPIYALGIEFRTVNGESIGALDDRPLLAHWAAAISDSAAQVDVDIASSSVENGLDFHRVHLVFSPSMPDNADGQLFLDTDGLLARNAGFGEGSGAWLGFNPEQADWYFGIDPNAWDDNGPPPSEPPSAAPPITAILSLLLMEPAVAQSDGESAVQAMP